MTSDTDICYRFLVSAFLLSGFWFLAGYLRRRTEVASLPTGLLPRYIVQVAALLGRSKNTTVGKLVPAHGSSRGVGAVSYNEVYILRETGVLHRIKGKQDK
ncbi:hypothetical protein DFH09DRAFT_1072463 [Mycena vulgaris]|nr:hypothetical protein DFH09DRAFT_1072463 [Mycena vulgaris]